MKNASQYARRIKTLFATVQREGSKPTTTATDDPLEQLMRGILSRTASEARAAAAWSRLRGATVDLNELRVTPVSELVEIIGRDYPQARSVAAQISRTLHAIFNRQPALNLDFMRSSTRTDAASFLNGLDGVDAHARPTAIMGTLGAHAIPSHDHMPPSLRPGRAESVAITSPSCKLKLPGRPPRFSSRRAPRAARADRAVPGAALEAVPKIRGEHADSAPHRVHL